MNEYELISQMIERGHKVYLACTGAPFDVPNRLLRVGGASKFMLGCTIPYNPKAFDEFVGRKVDCGYCSQLGAIMLAQASYRKAMAICFENNEPTQECVGIGASAAIATDRDRRGEDHIFFAYVNSSGLYVADFKLIKGNQRLSQGKACNELLMAIVVEATLGNMDLHYSMEQYMIRYTIDDIDNSYHRYMPEDKWFMVPKKFSYFEYTKLQEDIGTEDSEDTEYKLSALVNDETIVFLDKNGEFDDWNDYKDVVRHVVFPGTFNPLHIGHIRMAEIVEETYGLEVVFELSLSTADKGTVDVNQVMSKASQFLGRWPVLISGNKNNLLIDKARMYKPEGFIVGEDTLERLIDPFYYHHDAKLMDEVFEEFSILGVKLYTFRRQISESHIIQLMDMTTVVSEEFDISSTEIRGNK